MSNALSEEAHVTFDFALQPRIPNSPKSESLAVEEEQESKAAYLQTHRALQEALSEQSVLREKLRCFERRNQPPKFGRPVYVHPCQASIEQSDDTPPEKLIFELEKAQKMLENAKRAAETAKQEQQDLIASTKLFMKKAVGETEELVFRNAARHRAELQAEQQQFRDEIARWNQERGEYQAEAEHLSIASQASLHNCTVIRDEVEDQRRKIQFLASELRNCLTKSKELRDALDQGKNKIALTKNLLMEIESNNQSVESLNKMINEQKAILKAVRVSEQAQMVLDDLKAQTEELRVTKTNADNNLEKATREHIEAKRYEQEMKEKLSKAMKEFKTAQMEMLILESDVRELKTEHEKQRKLAIEEGRKNLELQRSLRVEKMEAAQRFIIENVDKIHRVDRVQTTLSRVRSKLDQRPTTACAGRAPKKPLKVTRKEKSSTPKTSRRRE